jgi:hypothetical protein
MKYYIYICLILLIPVGACTSILYLDYGNDGLAIGFVLWLVFSILGIFMFKYLEGDFSK